MGHRRECAPKVENPAATESIAPCVQRIAKNPEGLTPAHMCSIVHRLLKPRMAALRCAVIAAEAHPAQLILWVDMLCVPAEVEVRSSLLSRCRMISANTAYAGSLGLCCHLAHT